MIGGRVLDLSAVLGFARRDAVYLDALVWTAVEEDIVLLVPAGALSLAWAELDPPAHPVLEVLIGLPVTVVDTVTTARSREIGALLTGMPGARFDQVHAAVCALERGWPLVTGEPDAYAGIGELEVETLP